MTDEAPIFLRCPQVQERYAVSKKWIYENMRRGLFPRPVRIGPNSVRWRTADLEEWERSRPQTDPE